MKKTGVIILAVVILAVLLILSLSMIGGESQETEQTEIATQEAAQPETEAPEAPVLNGALRIDQIGSYTGLYVEDGSDDAVSDLLMVIVTNVSEEPVQYAEIALDVNGEAAKFTVSVLPAGGSAVLIEQNRMAYDASMEYDPAQAECVHLAGFDKPLTLQEDKLELQILDGVINITNISGADITETIILCYKNVSNDVYHGGIAYRVRLEGGLKADEIRQITGTHFHQPGSELMFVDLVA